MPDMKQLFEFIREGFNKKVDTDPAFRQQVCNFNKSILFVLSDNGVFNFTIRDGHVPAITEGTPLSWNIKVMTNTPDLLALLSGKLDPTQAILSRKLRVSSSLQDLAWLKRFLALNKNAISGILKDYEQGENS